MRLDWKWRLADIRQDKPVKVFSCFSCGGGSSMGYKRAGFEVVGNVEIDPKMAVMYQRNLHPRHSFNMDLRAFNVLPMEQIPDELRGIDILDGSPPCTTFSTAGKREKTWGVARDYAEGAARQTLDDLFMVFLDTVEKLRPKIVVAENVVGLLLGNAKGYVSEVISRFHALGYDVQLFRLNAAYMDVPQKRERVFFIANQLGLPKLKLSFHGQPIPFGKVRSEHGTPIDPGSMTARRLKHLRRGDRRISDITDRVEKRHVCFNEYIFWDGRVANTLSAGGVFYRACDRMRLSSEDCRAIQTFPADYDFCGNNVQYVCGMSVPPNMMAHIALEIWRQWLEPRARRQDLPRGRLQLGNERPAAPSPLPEHDRRERQGQGASGREGSAGGRGERVHARPG